MGSYFLPIVHFDLINVVDGDDGGGKGALDYEADALLAQGRAGELLQQLVDQVQQVLGEHNEHIYHLLLQKCFPCNITTIVSQTY